jgi:hypothetical protein
VNTAVSRQMESSLRLSAKGSKMEKKKSRKTYRKPGRPTLLIQPNVKQRLINAIRLGADMTTARKYAGVSDKALKNWLQWGNEEESGPYADFVLEMDKAFVECELRDLESLEKAANGQAEERNKVTGEITKLYIKPDWRAAAFRLERRYPTKYGRKQIIKIDDESAPANIDKPQQGSFDDINIHKQLVDLIKQKRSEK